MNSVWLGLALALVCSGLQAGERWLGSQFASVTIGPDGRVQEAALPNSSLGPDMQAEILRRVRQFEFEPATVDGVAATTETHLAVQLAVEPAGERLVVKVAGAGIAPRMTRIVPPRFPRSQLTRSQGAKIDLQISYDAAGQVIEASVASAEPDLKVFRKAALAAARDWRFAPERINGEAQAGSVLVPVRFEIASSRTGELKFPDGGKLQVSRQPEQADELLTSNVRLRSTEEPAQPAN